MEEKEANAILALLLKNGIDCEKVQGKENTWGLRVDKTHMAKAVALLQEGGFPKDRFIGIGDVFKREGLVSSPLQERVLYIYALSQQLSETLSHIDGVLTARVHVVIPENDPLSDAVKPSSASVFIKHLEFADMMAVIPKIKTMVVNSIEGLSYDRVNVVLFPSEQPPETTEKPAYERVLFLNVAPDSVKRFWALAGGLAGLCLAALGGLAYLFWTARKTGAPHEAAG